MSRPDSTLFNLAPELAVRYRLERELGRGGMATVYLVHDLRHDRPVALKLLHAGLGGALGPDRFLREIAIAARLQHPNILPLFDSGTTADRSGAVRLYYTMPFVAGESLRVRLDRDKQRPWAPVGGVTPRRRSRISASCGGRRTAGSMRP
jgi:serine/threonine-protein kinase